MIEFELLQKHNQPEQYWLLSYHTTVIFYRHHHDLIIAVPLSQSTLRRYSFLMLHNITSLELLKASPLDGCGGGEKAAEEEGCRTDEQIVQAGHRKAEIRPGDQGQVRRSGSLSALASTCPSPQETSTTLCKSQFPESESEGTDLWPYLELTLFEVNLHQCLIPRGSSHKQLQHPSL